MKITWEAKDIWPGRRVVAYNRTEQYIITYSPSMGANEARLGIASLVDGCSSGVLMDADGMAKYLSGMGVLPAELLPPRDEK